MPEEYIRDTKLRIMVLRLRIDAPPLVTDPGLPHLAATAALTEARERHIPYDFEMDFREHTKQFCSEVASAPYARYGVILWMNLSSISSPGLANWLASFGVRHFTTQEPSDLEYDPQLRVVGEWRDAETLLKDHMDNAVTDAMLEEAEKGKTLEYDWHLLPIARVLKLYSALLNIFDGEGPIPEGMSATAALRNKRFTADHKRLERALVKSVERFRRAHGYTPPYWELVRLARSALAGT